MAHEPRISGPGQEVEMGQQAPIDVLAVMRAARDRIEASGAPRYAARVELATSAVSDLIDALREIAAVTASGDDAPNPELINCRAQAALARVHGKQS